MSSANPDSMLRPVSSRASSRTGQTPSSTSLLLPGQQQDVQQTGGSTTPTQLPQQKSQKIPSVYLRTLFDDNFDELDQYNSLLRQYRVCPKSFSTHDIIEMSSVSNTPTTTTPSAPGHGRLGCSSFNLGGPRKSISECDLTTYSENVYAKNGVVAGVHDYITYSCSTLAICGDTVHASSQLPSPQTQSIRHLANAFLLSDLDLIKSFSRTMRTQCIRSRQREFVRSIDADTLSEHELHRIDALTSTGHRVLPSFLYNEDDLLTGGGGCDSGDIRIQVMDYTECDLSIQQSNNDDSHDDSVIECDLPHRNKSSHHPPPPPPPVLGGIHKKDRQMFVLNWLQNVDPTQNSSISPPTPLSGDATATDLEEDDHGASQNDHESQQ